MGAENVLLQNETQQLKEKAVLQETEVDKFEEKTHSYELNLQEKTHSYELNLQEKTRSYELNLQENKDLKAENLLLQNEMQQLKEKAALQEMSIHDLRTTADEYGTKLGSIELEKKTQATYFDRLETENATLHAESKLLKGKVLKMQSAIDKRTYAEPAQINILTSDNRC